MGGKQKLDSKPQSQAQ